MNIRVTISRVKTLPAPAAPGQVRATFRLEDGASVRVDTASPPMCRTLLGAAAAHQVPLWIHHDASSGLVQFVAVPLIGRPVSTATLPDGSLHVVLAPSHKHHILRRDHPRFDELKKVLEDTMNSADVAVLEDDDNIQDLVLAGPYRAALGKPAPAGGPQLAMTPVALPREDIDLLFGRVAERTCAPLVAADPCIPFAYPDDGCWARAHEMCRLLNETKFVARKTWIYGSLRVATANSPKCAVTWVYHVAPIVMEQGTNQVFVIDPSMAKAPVMLSDWESAQTLALHQSAQTGPEAYYRSPEGAVQVDPEFQDTKTTLAFYRLKLQERAAQFGSPPYQNCAV